MLQRRFLILLGFHFRNFKFIVNNSSGPRICVGNNFSLMEQKIFLSNLILNYEIEFVNEPKEIEVSHHSGLFQTPKAHPIRLTKI
jgi:cytochrome P450